MTILVFLRACFLGQICVDGMLDLLLSGQVVVMLCIISVHQHVEALHKTGAVIYVIIQVAVYLTRLFVAKNKTIPNCPREKLFPDGNSALFLCQENYKNPQSGSLSFNFKSSH